MLFPSLPQGCAIALSASRLQELLPWPFDGAFAALGMGFVATWSTAEL